MLDKKNLFRVSGVLPLLGTVAAGLYFIGATYENSLKNWLEEKSSLTYGAKIDIEDLSIQLFKGSATLSKIQITNPASPLKNFFEIDKIKVKFSFTELLKKKLVISSMDIQGVRPGTQRIYSGVLEDSVTNSESHPVLWEKTDSGVYGDLRSQIKQGPLKYLSQITTGAYTPTKLPNLKKTLSSLKYLQELNQNFEVAAREWNHQANMLPNPSQLDQWHTQVAQWENSNRNLASTEEAENRRKLALLLRENFQSIGQQLQTASKSLSRFKSQMDGINPLLAQDIESVKKELSLPSSAEQDLSFSLFGLQVINLLEKMSFWSHAYRNYGQVVISKPGFELIRTSSNGTTKYHFLNSISHPSLSIKKITLENAAESHGKKNLLKGEVSDFNLFPRFYKTACTLSLEAKIPDAEIDGLKVQVRLANESGTPKEEFNLVIESFPIDDATIRSTSDFDIKISHATGKIQAKGSVQGDEIDATGRFETIGTRFNVKSQFQPFEEILETLTKYRTTLLVDAKAHGDKNSVTLSIDSEFGKQLAKGITDTFNKQLAQIDDTLKTHILDSLFPLRQSFNEKVQDAENISLAQMRNTLSELEILMSYTHKYEPTSGKHKDRLGQNPTQNTNL
jgi:uncharacterized protein (TIGR03545 family)